MSEKELNTQIHKIEKQEGLTYFSTIYGANQEVLLCFLGRPDEVSITRLIPAPAGEEK